MRAPMFHFAFALPTGLFSLSLLSAAHSARTENGPRRKRPRQTGAPNLHGMIGLSTFSAKIGLKVP
jgi:hypothetical protein